MEKFYLEEPSIERKEEAIEYIEEFYKYQSHIAGSGSLDRYLKDYSYEEWLKKLEVYKDKDSALENGWVHAVTYFLIRESDNKIIGMINIRLELNDYLRNFGGHIGYGIRPTERRKGYNKINLYLGLLKCQEFRLDKVMISCNVHNLGSDKTIKAFDGELEKIEVDPNDNELTNVYWIDVDKAIDKYCNQYELYVSDKKVKVK